MADTTLTREEESIREHIVYVHLAERRYEVEDFDFTLSRETSPDRPAAPDHAVGLRSQKKPVSVPKGSGMAGPSS
jgi:hypothetical protein